MEENKYTMQSLDEYIRQGEPQQRERGEAWQVAIGLQQVDGLSPSSYLLDTARQHIDGETSIGEAKALIDKYYKSSANRTVQSAKEALQSAKEALPLPSKCKNCTLEEVAILRIVQQNPTVTQKQLAAEIGKSERTVKTITVELQTKGILQRVGGKRNGRWELQQD